MGWRNYNLTVSIDDNNPALETLVEALRGSLSGCADEKGCGGDGFVAVMGGSDGLSTQSNTAPAPKPGTNVKAMLKGAFFPPA